ncbi:MAG: hypothetical protein ACYDD6_02810 [Acidimicrobiales bacterium]
MRSRRAPIRAERRRVLLRLLFLSLFPVLMAAAVVGGQGRPAPVTSQPALSLASSSVPFSGSTPSPVTTPPTTAPTTSPTTAPVSSATVASTVPTVHTGEAWGSRWFPWVLALALALGLALVQPLFRRQARAVA